jgi:peptidoglycan hydrolase CwlO-like protein
MKRLQGIIAATIVTIVISLGMLVIGADAATNVNSVPVNNSPKGVPAAASLASAASSSTANASAQTAHDTAQAAQLTAMQAQIDQLQGLVKQYQTREQQYQTELKSQAQKLATANNQANTFQQVLTALQDRGLIQITSDGRIFVAGG